MKEVIDLKELCHAENSRWRSGKNYFVQYVTFLLDNNAVGIKYKQYSKRVSYPTDSVGYPKAKDSSGTTMLKSTFKFKNPVVQSCSSTQMIFTENDATYQADIASQTVIMIKEPARYRQAATGICASLFAIQIL